MCRLALLAWTTCSPPGRTSTFWCWTRKSTATPAARRCAAAAAAPPLPPPPPPHLPLLPAVPSSRATCRPARLGPLATTCLQLCSTRPTTAEQVLAPGLCRQVCCRRKDAAQEGAGPGNHAGGCLRCRSAARWERACSASHRPPDCRQAVGAAGCTTAFQVPRCTLRCGPPGAPVPRTFAPRSPRPRPLQCYPDVYVASVSLDANYNQVCGGGGCACVASQGSALRRGPAGAPPACSCSTTAGPAPCLCSLGLPSARCAPTSRQPSLAQCLLVCRSPRPGARRMGLACANTLFSPARPCTIHPPSCCRWSRP